MACAMVLRKRSSAELSFGDGVPPLKRMRTTPFTPTEVLSAITSLTRSASRGEQVSHEEKGRKRKREDSPSRPAKRQRVFSIEQPKEPDVVDSASVVAAAVEEMDTDAVKPIAEESVEKGSLAEDTVNGDALMDTEESTSSAAAPEVSVLAGGAAEAIEEGAVGGEQLGAEAAAPVLDAQFEEDFELICEIHPEVDPVYIREQLILYVNDPTRVSTVTFDIYSNVEAPKRADREARESALREREQLSNMTFDLEEFLMRYPDPLATFDVKDTDVTELYYDHAEVFLKNEFPIMQVNYIKGQLRRCGFHLTPGYMSLKKEHDAYQQSGFKGRKCGTKWRRSPRSDTYDYPEEADEDFYWERLFLWNKDQIIGHITAVKEAKRLRYEEAQREGRLRECAICVSTDVFLEDMAPCPEGHLFCLDCIRRSTEELLGQGRATFPCLNTDCQCHFTLHTLEKALPAQTFSLVVRRIQGEELRQAQIENIVSCPFCPYAVIIPDMNTSSIFHCENPDCMEDSCRNCKQIAHIPFSCEEFKKMREEDMMHYVENEMAEAMIRQCPKCNLRFFKEEGCNHMRCSNCNISICYICREEITNGYQHFRKSKACSNYVDIRQLHKDEVTNAFKGSEARFKEEHPELRSDRIKLTYNPLELLQI